MILVYALAVGCLASFCCMKSDFVFNEPNGIIYFTGKTLHELFNKDEKYYKVYWIIMHHSRKRIDVKLAAPHYLWSVDKNIIVAREKRLHGVVKKFFNNSFEDQFITNDAVEISLEGHFSNETYKLNLEIKFRPWCSTCGKTLLLLEDTSFNIQSPNFPHSYFPGCACIWHISSKSMKTYLKLVTNHFQLKTRLPNGECQDYLEIYEGVRAIKENSFGRFCGTESISFEFNHWITFIFYSHDHFNYSVTQEYRFDISIYNNEETSIGLQSVAAILGAISLGILIGLLICSVFYKRWYQRSGNMLENPNLESDYDDTPQVILPDAIQAAAPPSYIKVIESPKLFPAVKRENLFVVHHLEIPSSKPPQYSTDTNNGYDQIPLPSYASVSESEEEWFSSRSLNTLKRYSSDFSDQKPPSYEKVRTEGSDVVPILVNTKNKIRRKSRSERNSLSSMAQARVIIKRGDLEIEKELDGAIRSKSMRYKKMNDKASFKSLTIHSNPGEEMKNTSVKIEVDHHPEQKIRTSMIDEPSNVSIVLNHSASTSTQSETSVSTQFDSEDFSKET